MMKRLFLAVPVLFWALAGCNDSASPSGNRPNLLLVTIDTVRSDRLGAYGYEQARTPVLDDLAERGVLFEQAYAPAPMTLPVHATLMTGLLPPEHGARVNGMHTLADGVPTLAEDLKAGGYRTAAFVAAFVLDSRFGLDRGFDVYDDDLSRAYEQEVHEELSSYRPGDVVVDAALDWLDEGMPGEPFFAWVHLYDAHFPWHPHGEGAAEGTESGTYDGEVAFVDEQIGRLVEFLGRSGLDGNTVVVVLADHGEGLGDHREIEHAFLLNEEVLHVPWIIAGPGVPSGQRVPSLVTLESFHPTALELLGLPRAEGAVSLVAAMHGETVLDRESYAETDLPWTAFRWGPQRSLTTSDWKYVRSPQPELYDRHADRGELCNLASARRDVLEGLEARLRSIEAGLVVRESDVATVGAEQLAQLAGLGYAAGTEGDAPPDLGGLADVKERFAVKELAAELRRGVDTGTLTPEQQLAMAQRLVEASPETPVFHAELGAALVTLGARERAVEALEHALELAPNDPGAHYTLGDCLQQLGRTGEAREHLELALEMEPSMEVAHVGLGNVLRDEGRPDLAAGEYTEALRLRPGYAEAYYNLAQTFAERGKPEKALETLQLALEHKPGWGLAHRALANMLFSFGRLDESIEHFVAALESFPRDAGLHNDLGVACYRLGRYEDAQQAFVRALEFAPEFFRPYLNLGNLAFDFGHDELAREQYETALQLEPGHAEPCVCLARLLATTGSDELLDGPRAVALAERANQLTGSREPRVLDTLAAAYAAAGRFEDALGAATRAEVLAAQAGDEALVREIQERAALYGVERPFRVLRPAPTAQAPTLELAVGES